MHNGLRYYGRKGGEYLSRVEQILPEEGVNVMADCCFGSGNFTLNISCEMNNVKQIGFELDRSLYTLHSVIKSSQVFELTDRIKDVLRDEKYYRNCETLVRNYNERIESYSDIDIALAELVMIYFSINNGRTQRRNPYSYKKYTMGSSKRNDSRVQIQQMESRFYYRVPADIYDIHVAWQEVEIYNDDFRNHYEELFTDEGTFLFIDPPYLLDKRGRKRESKAIKAGYDMDWELKDHEDFVGKLMEYSRGGSLRAKVMICSNFEIDDEDRLIGLEDDPYTVLIKEAGFRMVVVQKRYTSEVKKQSGGHKKRKVEVVYINYDNIIGSWENFQYFDRTYFSTLA